MLGLTLRGEFRGQHLPSTAVSLIEPDGTGATQVPAQQVLSITYPTGDIQTDSDSLVNFKRPANSFRANLSWRNYSRPVPPPSCSTSFRNGSTAFTTRTARPASSGALTPSASSKFFPRSLANAPTASSS